MVSQVKQLIKHLLGKDLFIKAQKGSIPIEFHGNLYGGWSILSNSINSESVIYSFGIGEDVSFDLSLINKYDCDIFAFDPTPKSITWIEKNVHTEKFNHLPWALSDRDGNMDFFLPANQNHVSASFKQGKHSSDTVFNASCYKLKTIMDKLSHKYIDILKMDIEGSEYHAIRNIADEGLLSSIDQLLVEFHHFMSSFSIEDTKAMIALLKANGYHPRWVSTGGHEVLFSR